MNLPSEGLPWLEQSAAGGYAHAQSKLGIIYATGKHVEKDLDKAAELMRQAALQGNKDAANNLAIVEKQIAAQKKQAETPRSSTDPTNGRCDISADGKACTQCGAALQDGAKFCGGCGAKVEQAQFCTGCGAKMVAGTKFCGECGTGVGDTPGQSDVRPIQVTEPVVDDLSDEDEDSDSGDSGESLESAYDFAEKAEELLREGDPDNAREHIERGLELVEDVSDLVNLATLACHSDEEEGLGDKEWGRELFQQAAEMAENFFDNKSLAVEVAREELLGDEEWARVLFAKAEEKAEDLVDLNDLANSVVTSLSDTEWCKNLVKKAETSSPETSDLEAMARTVLGLNDLEWARELLTKGVNTASSTTALVSIAGCIKDDLEDYDWALQVMAKALESADDYSEYLECAQHYGYHFDDKDKARRVFEQAVEKAETTDALIDIAAYMIDEDYLGDTGVGKSTTRSRRRDARQR